jgi:hypothetical protein
MRILSPYKDFYDYVVIETDNRKVYNRETKDVVFTELEHNKAPERTFLSPLTYDKIDQMRVKGFHAFGKGITFGKGHIGVLAFCDRLRSFLIYDDIIYWHYEDIPEEIVKTLRKSVESRWSRWDKVDKSYEKSVWGRDPLKDILHFKKIDWVLDRHTKEPIKTNLNKIFDTPVLRYSGVRNITLNPKLNEMGFNKAITPTEAYQDIYNWIPYNEPEVPKSPDDMNRYEAKGFDKKTSFRPNMK